MKTLQPGDVFFTRSKTFLGKLIRTCTRIIGESRTKANHVGIVRLALAGGPQHTLVIEALSRVKMHRFEDQYDPRKTDIWVYRHLGLSRSRKARIAGRAMSYVGATYGYVKIVAHLLDWCLLGAYVFRRIFASDRYPICSWLAEHALAAGGVRLMPHFGASPDDLWDVVANSEDWELVYTTEDTNKW